MPAPERPPVTVQPLVGQRVVVDPALLDALIATLPASATAIQFAPDEALVVWVASLHLEDLDAIVEDEVGFVAVTVDREVVARHTEWPLTAVGDVAQGAVAGVPAKVALLPDGRAWVLTHAAYVADLLDRLT